MTNDTQTLTHLHAPTRPRGDVPATRACLSCSTMFASEGFGHRVCPRCKNTVVWCGGASSGPGRSSRRTGGRSG